MKKRPFNSKCFQLAVLLLFLCMLVSFADGEKKGVYSSNLNPENDIDLAVKKASEDCKRILLVFGADWCPWCNRIAKYFAENEKVAQKLTDNYHVVKIDVGKWDKNLELTKKYQVQRKAGIPFIVVLNKAGELITFQETGSLEKGKGYSGEKVLAFLKKHQRAGSSDCEK